MSLELKENQILAARDVNVRFYTYAGVVHAVSDAYLDIFERETVALVGETGSGKTVFTRALTRLIEPPGRIESGRIYFRRRNGSVVELLKLTESELRDVRGNEISYVFQDPSSALDPLYTAGEHIVETILEHRAVSKDEAWNEAIQLLQDVMIPNPEVRVKSYPHELSGGLRQRVVIATAISNKPRLLIADEPTTNLDVTVQAQILDLLRELRNKYGMSLLLITHNLGIVAEIADRVYVMYGGRIAETADVYTLFESPQHPYTQLLLKCVPNPLKKVEKLESIPGTVPNLIDVKPGCPFAPRCPFAMEICRTQNPPKVELGKGHFVHCWLYSKR
ncbi:peptide ABC transporter ATPase [Infirmifilum uzonense]|uniref:Nickel import system ATP-binding protein NikD n=1 Tax=Infirmifilum uzonense TaxID=1550241 RepID=A0A0F7FG02_9CREN|nr:ABC transporter ATP-binding protein [Infirmifilum uzonense]AKG38105.1 peptide ABC transporter ATPase [Infirmifilum uzonense]